MAVISRIQAVIRDQRVFGRELIRILLLFRIVVRIKARLSSHEGNIGIIIVTVPAGIIEAERINIAPEVCPDDCGPVTLDDLILIHMI